MSRARRMGSFQDLCRCRVWGVQMGASSRWTMRLVTTKVRQSRPHVQQSMSCPLPLIHRQEGSDASRARWSLELEGRGRPRSSVDIASEVLDGAFIKWTMRSNNVHMHQNLFELLHWCVGNLRQVQHWCCGDSSSKVWAVSRPVSMSLLWCTGMEQLVGGRWDLSLL